MENANYMFFVEFPEYTDVTSCLSEKQARRGYNKYSKNPSINAVRWGWEVDNDRISVKVIKNKMKNDFTFEH